MMTVVRKRITGCLSVIAAASIAALPSLAPAEPGCAAHTACQQPACDSAEARARVREMIRLQTFTSLPASHQQRIAAAAPHLVPTAPAPDVRGAVEAAALRMGPTTPDVQYRHVAHVIDRETFDSFSPTHQRVLSELAQTLENFGPVVALCFTPDADPELVGAINNLYAEAAGGTQRFQQTARWSSTASDPGPFSQGDPTTLTYSFVPDGTTVSDIGVGFGSGISDLDAFLTGIYGSTAAWQQIYHEMFDLWGSLCGNTYIHETNDDGAPTNVNPGVLGVRGDLRMAGFPLDGNSGVLAYNNFPNDGDMVIDTADSFYTNTGSNSIRLRNVLAHEHGHGMGQLHVCPIEESKLMEPFFSDNFVGPQLDDIQNAQRHYGDELEHNDTSATASSLGTIDSGLVSRSTISIDDNSDVDYFSVTVTDARELTATATPIGAAYLEGPQTQQCDNGTLRDSLNIHDLGIEILDTNGSSVLAGGNVSPLGQPEEAVAVLPEAGTYFVRVNPDSVNDIQLYDLRVEVADPPFIPITIVLPDGVPSEVEPAVATAFDVRIIEGDDALSGTPQLNYRFDGGTFQSSPLTFVADDMYTATLPPADCGDTPEFFVSAVGVTTGSVSKPEAGASDPFVASVTSGSSVTFADNFETDQGWTTAANAADGNWERGVPVNNGRGDPPSDADGSGQCYLTGNDPSDANSDVDNGSTTLTSPLFDLSLGGTVSYQYWVDSGPGVIDDDFLAVEIATNASSTNWTRVREYTSAVPAWQSDSIDVAAEVGASSTVRVRFIAADLGTQSLIEAGVDAFDVVALECQQPTTCPGDVDGNGTVDVNDISFVIFRLGDSGAPGEVEGDADGNGIVDVNDISFVIFRLGPCD